MIALIVVWGLLFAAAMPIRQAYMNGLIPSRQRATILSFDSLMSSGGVWAQPALGRAADVWGYPPSYLISAAITRSRCRRSISHAGRTSRRTASPRRRGGGRAPAPGRRAVAPPAVESEPG